MGTFGDPPGPAGQPFRFQDGLEGPAVRAIPGGGRLEDESFGRHKQVPHAPGRAQFRYFLEPFAHRAGGFVVRLGASALIAQHPRIRVKRAHRVVFHVACHEEADLLERLDLPALVQHVGDRHRDADEDEGDDDDHDEDGDCKLIGIVSAAHVLPIAGAHEALRRVGERREEHEPRQGVAFDAEQRDDLQHVERVVDKGLRV
mmetsp:Transcript_6814/g.17425  ORF Transcript_6814/g.17425 Transcript_6814/m.17425 type:complete len:202 (-) Transcript_6814:851-1456(-)